MLHHVKLAITNNQDLLKLWQTTRLDMTNRWNRTPAMLILAFVFTFIILFMIVCSLIKSDVDRLDAIDKSIYEYPNIPYFNETIAKFRERGAKLTAENLKVSEDPQIFVSIASFRDNSCRETLKALFETAEIPQRVFAGVVDQVSISKESDDVPCDSILPSVYRKQVRMVRIPPDEARGPTHARYIASKLWQGEMYFMQIDSHSGFSKGWDNDLVDMITNLPSTKSLISHYPPSFENINSISSEQVEWICSATGDNAPDGLIIQIPSLCQPFNRSPIRKDESIPSQCYSPFIGAGFLAGPSHMLMDAPFDRYLPMLFHGEELLIAARLWTRGWDLFTPSKSLVSHKYGGRSKNVFVQVAEWSEIIEQSRARARAILDTSLENEPDYPRDEIEELGVGNVRSLASYYEYAGLHDIKGRKFESRCGQRYDPKLGRWVNATVSG